YIDVTAVGTDLLEDVSCWHLPAYDSLSDHKAIEFDIALNSNSPSNDDDSCIFNLKKANWKLFYDSSKYLLSSISDLIVSCQNPESLHDLAKELISIEIRNDALINSNVTDDPPFTIHEIDAVINKLKLKKAPGPDSIPNEVVKKLHEMYPDLFLIVFNSCLRLKTFPRCWKKARIILIPKVNAVRVPNLDNLRCISLLSTLGKCFERLIINRVAWRLYKDNYFNKNQFGFMPQKCTEDALVKLNEIVLKGKKRNLHTILVFLDIKGAFDNAWWPGILSLLKRSNIPGNLFAVISSFLKDRSVTLSLGHSSKEKLLNKGCPQGSVSGPFLWNVIINDFLEKILAFSSCETIAFADDLLLCFQGKSFPDLSRQAQFTLDFASTWTKNYKLEFNAVKSKVMILERRENNVLTGNLTLNGFSLDCVKELKYLGIVLDKSLESSPTLMMRGISQGRNTSFDIRKEKDFLGKN
ncbi:RNA-directed DNA polymerase from mobile element jockey, partial [Trichonephila inaurata madagascariensis]